MHHEGLSRIGSLERRRFAREHINLNGRALREVHSFMHLQEEGAVEKLSQSTNIFSMLDTLVSELSSDTWVNTVRTIKQQARHATHDEIEACETYVARFLKKEKAIGFPLLCALAEIGQCSNSPFVAPDLSIELTYGFGRLSPEMFDQISFLSRNQHPNARLAAHKVFDFFERLMVSIQNDETMAMIKKGPPQGRGDIFINLYRYATEEARLTTNYLLHQHLLSLVELREIGVNPRPGAITGMSGGNARQTMFRYHHLAENAHNREQLGVHTGTVFSDPIFKIAPGYYGAYRGERIEKIYAEPQGHVVNSTEKVFIEQNNPEDEYIYAILSSPIDSHNKTERQYSTANLLRLNDLHTFLEDLKEEGRHFYFDISRLDTTVIHPYVLGEIYVANDRYRMRYEQKNTTPPDARNDFEHELFPLGNPTAEKRYAYFFLTSFSMRQTILDDFGLDISEIPLWSQRHFLTALERSTTSEAQQLATIVTHNSQT